MTLDLSALRAKLNELKGVAAKNDILWKPTEGDNLVRIVPLKDSPDNPFIELYFHYLGNKTYLSPLSFGEPDPIAEFADTLRAGGGLTKDEWRETKKFVPQRRTFVPVIDRNKPQSGVKFWAFGKTVYSEILSVMADPEYGDITDPQTGRDIKVIFTPQEKSDTSFAKTSIRVSPKQTALTPNAEELEKFLNEQPDLMSIHKKMSYDELKNVLNVLVGGAPAATGRTVVNKNDDDWGEDATPSPSAEKARAGKSRKTANDVEDEFASMFEK
jgi:hypothetical protein